MVNKRKHMSNQLLFLMALLLVSVVILSGCRPGVCSYGVCSYSGVMEEKTEEAEYFGTEANTQSEQSISSVSTQTSIVCTNGHCQELTVHQSTEIYCINGICEVRSLEETDNQK